MGKYQQVTGLRETLLSSKIEMMAIKILMLCLVAFMTFNLSKGEETTEYPYGDYTEGDYVGYTTEYPYGDYTEGNYGDYTEGDYGGYTTEYPYGDYTEGNIGDYTEGDYGDFTTEANA